MKKCARQHSPAAAVAAAPLAFMECESTCSCISFPQCAHYIFRTLIKHRLREFASERAWEGFIDAAGAAVCFQLALKAKTRLIDAESETSKWKRMVCAYLGKFLRGNHSGRKRSNCSKSGAHVSTDPLYPLVLYSLVIFHCIFVRAKCRFF